MATAQASTTTATARPARKPWPRWVVWTGWTLLGIFIAVSAVFLLTLWFGGVHGVELNPYTFARRSYSFYEIPLLRIQVRGIRREDVSSVTVDFLALNKYVTPVKGAPDEWHIVIGTRGVRAPVIGDADILVRYLEAQDADAHHKWEDWSQKNPKLAAVFWPSVSRLAQEEEYVFIPDLFELAASASDPVALQNALNKKVAERLKLLGQTLKDAGDAAAQKYFDEATQLQKPVTAPPATPEQKKATPEQPKPTPAS